MGPEDYLKLEDVFCLHREYLDIEGFLFADGHVAEHVRPPIGEHYEHTICLHFYIKYGRCCCTPQFDGFGMLRVAARS